MNPKHFFTQLQQDQIVQAIRDAEAHTSGQIRVFISRRHLPDPVTAAQTHFLKLKMDRTTHRNAILILVAPRSQTFAVIGDVAVHSRCGPSFWQALTNEMTPHFQRAQYTTALLHAIHLTGQLLSQHFPPSPQTQTNLPDTLLHD